MYISRGPPGPTYRVGQSIFGVIPLVLYLWCWRVGLGRGMSARRGVSLSLWSVCGVGDLQPASQLCGRHPRDFGRVAAIGPGAGHGYDNYTYRRLQSVETPSMRKIGGGGAVWLGRTVLVCLPIIPCCLLCVVVITPYPRWSLCCLVHALCNLKYETNLW